MIHEQCFEIISFVWALELEAKVTGSLVTCFGRHKLNLKLILLLMWSTCVKNVFCLATQA